MKTVAFAAAAAIASAAGADVTLGVDDSSAPWLGFMNVFELPENGGGFVFGSGWGVPDLTASFDDAAPSVTMGPNTIGDPNEFWYQNTTGNAPDPVNPGGPGQLGNKFMEANLFQNINDGSLSGTTVRFSGNVLDFSMTGAHEVSVFIKDFTADFSAFNESRAVIDAAGNFSISLDTIDEVGRNVQFGITVAGVNVWETDVAPFGNAVFQTVPAPGAAALLGLGGLVAARRRR